MVRVTVPGGTIMFTHVQIDHEQGVRYKVSKKKKVLRVFDSEGDEIAQYRSWVRVAREITVKTERERA